MGKGGASGRYDRREREPDCEICTWVERWHDDPESIPTLTTEGARDRLILTVTSHQFVAVCVFGATMATRSEPCCETLIATGRMCGAHKQHDRWEPTPEPAGRAD